jgi:glutamine amidotransferase
MKVVVIKLGVGNTASVMFALARLGVAAQLSSDKSQIAEAERLILPGVAAARHAMAQISALDLRETLCAFVRPMLGICLGQQLLYQASEEGETDALGLINGRVEKLKPTSAATLPHMGWSKLKMRRDHALLEGVRNGDYAYFAHSYACPVGAETIATSDYTTPFAALIAKANLFGCQFHPERSGVLGQRILANFMNLSC